MTAHVCVFRVTPTYSQNGVLLHDSVCLTCFKTRVGVPFRAVQARLIGTDRKGEK